MASEHERCLVERTGIAVLRLVVAAAVAVVVTGDATQASAGAGTVGSAASPLAAVARRLPWTVGLFGAVSLAAYVVRPAVGAWVRRRLRPSDEETGGATRAVARAAGSATITLPAVLGGVVLVERATEWPGVGALLVRSLLRREFGTVQLAFVALAAVSVTGRLAAAAARDRLDAQLPDER